MDNTRETTLPIVEMARNNSEYRKIVWTGEKSQVVLMAIEEGGEIGGEVHEGHDQMLWFVDGEGVAKIGEREEPVKAGDVSIVPSGAWHNFKNTGSGMLRLYTVYSPPEHAPGTRHVTRDDAES